MRLTFNQRIYKYFVQEGLKIAKEEDDILVWKYIPAQINAVIVKFFNKEDLKNITKENKNKVEG